MKINFDSPYRLDDGYGNVGEQILLALDRHPEVEVYTSNSWPKVNSNIRKGLSKRTIDLWSRGFNKGAEFSIRFCQPDSFSNAPACTRAKIGWSMWEFTNIPQAWVSGSNSVPAVFVPCLHNKELWVRAGTRVPVHVVPLGINKYVFYYRPDNTFDGPRMVSTCTEPVEYRRTFNGFTFMMTGTVCPRKQPRLVYDTFNKLFADKNDVRLIMKTPKRMPLGYKETHNIKIIAETWNPVRIADLLRESDCFLYPTRGEGFGLSPVEAMAVGSTAIVTDWSGPADYLDDEYAYKLGYTLDGKVGSHWGDIFGFPTPDAKQFEELVWHVYTHQDEARDKGKLAAKYVANHLTSDHTAQRIVDILRGM